jgi:serine protease
MAASEWCVDKGANIINLSIASDFKSSQEMFLYEKYYNDDILMIAAAGNGNSDKYAYPASYDSVMSVASVDSENRVSSFSQLNDQVEIAAPGEDIHTTGGYGVTLFTGTSFATPFVAGIAAKIWAANPQCNAMQIRKALLHSAKPLSKDVPSSDTGYGLVQAVEASNYIILNLPPPCGGVKPTLQPTLAPTKNPTRNPTTTPTLSPTTPLPSGVPTPAPTTGVPTVSERPSFVPTASPTTSAPTTCQEYLQVCDVNNGAVCCSGLDCRSVNDSPAMANACQNSGAPFRILKLTFILPIVVIVLNEWLL